MNSKVHTSRSPRQPDQVRKRLFDAATTLLSEGLPVSIGTIADLAGVSKGAVQHHFGTRDHLFAALGELYVTEFNDALAMEEASDPPAMRYAHLSLKGSSYKDDKGWRALLVASVVDRGIAERWSKQVESERSSDPVSSPNALLVRLAADGLWLSDLLDTYKISNENRGELALLMRKLLTDR